MSLINTHKFHALKILTFTLGLGALQPSDAAETPETTLITPSSLEIENVNTATATHPTFDENKAETETEGQINEIEKEKHNYWRK